MTTFLKISKTKPFICHEKLKFYFQKMDLKYGSDAQQENKILESYDLRFSLTLSAVFEDVVVKYTFRAF